MSTTRKINWDDYKVSPQRLTPEEFAKEYLCDCTFEPSSDVAKDDRDMPAVNLRRSPVLEDFLVHKRGG